MTCRVLSKSLTGLAIAQRAARAVQSDISDFGFEVQDSSNFTFLSA